MLWGMVASEGEVPTTEAEADAGGESPKAEADTDSVASPGEVSRAEAGAECVGEATERRSGEFAFN